MKSKMSLLISMTVTLVMAFSSPAVAAPITDISFDEAYIGGGRFQYDYTAYNISTAGEYLIGFTLEVVGINPTFPVGWGVSPGPDGFMFAEPDWKKLIEKKVDGEPIGFPPDIPGNAIGSEDSLSGFSIQTYSNVGIIPYTAYFWDPLDKLIVSATGFTAPINPVPEPTTLFLLGGGIICLTLVRMRKKFRIALAQARPQA